MKVKFIMIFVFYIYEQDDTSDFHHVQRPYIRWDDDLVSFLNWHIVYSFISSLVVQREMF